MRITRISRLRNCGIFRDSTWPSDLPEFADYNLIYGWNGTGKTTLSRILRCLEKRTAPEGEIKVVLDGRDVRGSDFPNVEVPLRVFNREFITENVFPVHGGDLPPILVLGAESVEKQKDLERLKGERATAQRKLESTRDTEQKAERDFDQFCVDRALVIKETLRSSGQNPYNNYDKSDFRRKAEEMAKAGDDASNRLSEPDKDALLKRHRSVPKEKVSEVVYTFPDFSEIIKKLSDLLEATVVSETIKTLKDDPVLNEWIRQGLQLHRERNVECCLFCEQPMPKNRLAALEAHFSTQYEQFMQRLEQAIKELQQMSNVASELQLPKKAELYEDLWKDFQAAETGLSEALDATRRFFDPAVKALMEKKNRAFEHVKLEFQAPLVDANAVEKLNAVVRKHNQACDGFQSRVNSARERLALDMIAEALPEFVKLWEAIEQAKKGVEAAELDVQHLNNEIEHLEKEIIEHRQPADELNKELRQYLGHDELRLDIKETGYTITRGGVPAQALSEGEMTAIALLYFLKSLRDRSFDLANGVVVLDDPVSSLDANALYLAFGFIRERTEDAGQLFILTHNFTFFRQVRNWFHHLKGQKKKDPSKRPARFYMVECRRDGEQRRATICQLDPLLEEYESEYQYLFACVYRGALNSAAAKLEENYILPNVARRLLESFLAFRYPGTSGELREKMKVVKFDEVKKQRILRFLHMHSHSDAVDEPQHDFSLLSETNSVLTDLLELIETEDKPHFDAMVTLLNRQVEEDNEE